MKKKIAVLTASVLLAAVWTRRCFKSSGNTWDGSEKQHLRGSDDLSCAESANGTIRLN